MNHLRKIACGCLSAAIMCTAVASAPVTARAASVKLNKSAATLTVGKKLTLKVQNAKKGAKVKWSSNKKSVAAVSQKGIVTAKAVGKATIKAVVNKTTLQCSITVQAKDVPNVESVDVTANFAGRSYKGTAVTPIGNMDVTNLTFGDDGTITGTKMNETTFTAEEFSGTYKAVLTGRKVTITVDANGDSFSYELTLESDDYSKLSATQSFGTIDISVTIEEIKD